MLTGRPVAQSYPSSIKMGTFSTFAANVSVTNGLCILALACLAQRHLSIECFSLFKKWFLGFSFGKSFLLRWNEVKRKAAFLFASLHPSPSSFEQLIATSNLELSCFDFSISSFTLRLHWRAQINNSSKYIRIIYLGSIYNCYTCYTNRQIVKFQLFAP